MPAGTPRGFSLQSHLPVGFPQAGMPPGVYAPGWSGMPGSLSSAGPVRTQGGRYGNNYRNVGPYSRPEGRNGRQPSFSGRNGPYEGGLGAIGPPQATQGRVMRSYEDLDAAGPATKEPELDY